MNPPGFSGERSGGTLVQILTDASGEALTDAIERNCIDFFMEYGRGPGGEVHEERGVTWFATGLPHPLFNGVMAADLAPDEIEGRIDDLAGEFRTRHLPLEWTVGSSTRPRDLGRALEAKGLRQVLRVPGMAVPLADVPDEHLPEGFAIAPARERADLELALRVALTTFEIPVVLVPRLVDLESSLPESHREVTQVFLGRLRGRPVGSSVLFLSGGVAGVYFVGTLPGVRGRGIGRAMTVMALQAGRERGYRFGALQATAMGVPVYRRLGFREYSTFEIYS